MSTAKAPDQYQAIIFCANCGQPAGPRYTYTFIHGCRYAVCDPPCAGVPAAVHRDTAPNR
jgi:recombinational DNA repair protein (RecF pathway)